MNPGTRSDAPGGARSRWRQGLLLLLAQVLSLGIVLALARARYRVGAVEVELAVSPAAVGTTRLLVPPLGHLDAYTHPTPLLLSVMPVAIHARSIDMLLDQLTARQDTLARMERDGAAAVRRFVLRLLLLAFGAGMLGTLVMGTRRLRGLLLGGLLSVGIVAATIGVTARYYRLAAFAHPEYRGLLSQAPPLFDMLRRGLEGLPELKAQLGHAMRSVAEVYARIEAAPPSRLTNTVRVLHVSDLHNNPVGLDFVAELHQAYQMQATIVTGDTTDYGTPLENELVRGWARIPGPKVFIAGNHDSRTTMAAVQAVPGALVLADGQPIEVAGLRIVGWNDPVAERDGFGDPAHKPADLARYEELLRDWMARGEAADLAVLHHYAPAKLLAGRAPLVLFGHDHQARVEKEGGTLFVDAGTTGAGGTRYLTSPKHPPFSAAILHFTGAGRRELVAVDMVSVREPTGDFTIERTSVEREKPVPGRPTIAAPGTGPGRIE